MTLETIKRLSALVILLSLLLPQRSCVSNDLVEVFYPLSNSDSAGSYALILAFYVLPLALLVLARLFVRLTLASQVLGVAVSGAGLYFIAYGSSIAATSLLVGWYAYTVATVVYLLACATQVGRSFYDRAQ